MFCLFLHRDNSSERERDALTHDTDTKWAQTKPVSQPQLVLCPCPHIKSRIQANLSCLHHRLPLCSHISLFLLSHLTCTYKKLWEHCIFNQNKNPQALADIPLTWEEELPFTERSQFRVRWAALELAWFQDLAHGLLSSMDLMDCHYHPFLACNYVCLFCLKNVKKIVNKWAL